jgi:hypothetical protein
MNILPIVPYLCRQPPPSILLSSGWRPPCVQDRPRVPAIMSPERLEIGGPRFTVETAVNGDSKSTMKGVLSLLFRWACLVGTRDFCFCLGCSSQPSTKYFFPHRTLFPFLCASCPASWAGSRAGSPISYYVSLIVTPRVQNIEQKSRWKRRTVEGTWQQYV